MHRIEEVTDTIIKLKLNTFFSTDASNGYWAIPIKDGDQYKAGLVTPHGQYIHLRMGQGLKGACATYSQFDDLVFGPSSCHVAWNLNPSQGTGQLSNGWFP